MISPGLLPMTRSSDCPQNKPTGGNGIPPDIRNIGDILTVLSYTISISEPEELPSSQGVSGARAGMWRPNNPLIEKGQTLMLVS